MSRFIKSVSNVYKNEVSLDPETLISAFGSYKKGTFAGRHLFDLDGLSFSLRIYPNGQSNETRRNKLTILLCIKGDIMNDDRLVSYRITGKKNPPEQNSDDSDADLNIVTMAYNSKYTIKSFTLPRGWTFNHSRIRESDEIHFQVEFERRSQSDWKKKREEFQSQLERMNVLSREHGDITLIVKIQTDDSEELCEPPAKKQRIEDVEIKVSSVILRSASKVFDNMLSNEMREKNENKIEVFAQSVDDVNAMIYFMCTNELPIERNALSLIHLAHFYQMDRLFSECAQEIIQKVSVDNFANALSIFDKYAIKNGYKALVNFAKKKKKELKSSKDYDKISHPFKCTVLNEAA